MAFEQLIRDHLGAIPIKEDWIFPDFYDNCNRFRDRGYCDQDSNLQRAAEILVYIKHRYLQYKSGDLGVGSTKSDDSPGSKALQQRLVGMGEEEFLAELFEHPRYGPGIHEQCEIILHKFPTAGPSLIDGLTVTPSFLWVRTEYLQILHYLEVSGQHGVVVTGQPGIGKTRLLHYLLISRLRSDKPVLIQLPGKGLLILCHTSGIYEIPMNEAQDQPVHHRNLQHQSLAEYFKDLWLLLDANDYPLRIPKWALRVIGAKVVYASSPRQTRWTLAQDEFFPREVVMNPYSRSEALLLAILEAEARPLKVPSDLPRTLERKLELCRTAMKFYTHNPGPRCFITEAWSANDPEGAFRRLEGTTAAKVFRIKSEDLQKLFDLEVDATSNTYSHRIVCVERHPDDNNYYRRNGDSVRGQLRLLNNKVLVCLTNRLARLSQDSRRDFFNMVSGNPDTRSIARKMFQGQLWQDWMKKGIHLAIHKVEDHTNPRSIVYCSTSDSVKLDIDVDKVACDYYLPKSIEYNVLCYPENPRFPGIDFLIRDYQTQRYYGIQATLAETHQITDRLEAVIDQKKIGDHEYTHVFVQGRLEQQAADVKRFSVPKVNFGFPIVVAWVDCPWGP